MSQIALPLYIAPSLPCSALELMSSPTPFAIVPRILAMEDDKIWYSANVPWPADFPTHDDIAKACAKSGFNRNGVCIRVAGKPRLWVKYGHSTNLRGEGRTQAHVAKIVNANPAGVVRVPDVHLGFSRKGCEYIVMDFVQGVTLEQCKSPNGGYYKKDLEAVAAAFWQLTEIKMPADTAPGPVGGGRIGHDFFNECRSMLEYPTVEHLEAQINKVLRPVGAIRLRVDFKSETADGLVLCLSDPNDSNFMYDSERQLWAIDFGRTCFLPPSFVSFSLTPLTGPSDVFVRRVARLVNYPQSANITALSIASGQLIMSGNNYLGATAMRSPTTSDIKRWAEGIAKVKTDNRKVG